MSRITIVDIRISLTNRLRTRVPNSIDEGRVTSIYSIRSCVLAKYLNIEVCNGVTSA